MRGLFQAKKLAWLALLAAAVVASGCSTEVKRMETSEVKDLSGAWNDTDSQLVSAEMIDDALSRSWLTNFTQANKRQPAVIVGEIQNLSHEHINTDAFVTDIERGLINSDRVQFVASSAERQELREERKEMDINASEATRKAAGQEKGADFMLKGTINTILDVSGREQIRYYQVNLTLISLVDNRIVWVGQKKIKKQVKNSNLRF